MATRSGVSQAKRRALMRDSRYACQFCGVRGREVRTKNPWAKNATFSYPTTISGLSLSIDHVIPRSRGGSSDLPNLRVLCTSCNGLRGAPIFSEEVTAIEEHW